MVRKTAHLAAVLLILGGLATAAWAATNGPKTNGYYASSRPRLSVYVDKPATRVQLYIGCFKSSAVAEYWDNTKVALKHGKFSFDGKTTISTENGATFGHFKGTVLFNGKFSRGKFRGTAQIVGSTCSKSSYTAKLDKNGGGSGH